MGKKTDRIEELTCQRDQLVLERDTQLSLIRQIGQALGIVVSGVITATNVDSYTARFIAALSPRRAPNIDRDAMTGTSIEDLDREIDRANASVAHLDNEVRQTAAIRRPDPERVGSPYDGDGFALAPDDPAALACTDGAECPDAAMHPDDRKTINDIAVELGVDVSLDHPADALRRIAREIHQIKNSGADFSPDASNPLLSKGDTLAQAIQHSTKQSQHFQDEIVRIRKILGAIAGAMQIGTWDADGTELLEKIQRWETFKHFLSRRVRELMTLYASSPTETDVVRIYKFAADELQIHLARLMAPREFAKWLENKPRGVLSSDAIKTLIADQSPPPFAEWGHGDIIRLVRLLSHEGALEAPASARPMAGFVLTTFAEIAGSVVASDEFVRLMNLVILPIVARQKAVRGTPPPPPPLAAA